MSVIEENRYFIATAVFILGMQGLMNIADEVDEEAKGLSSLPMWEMNVHDSFSVVGDCGDDASFGEAVSGYVDAALTRWIILSVDVVPCGRVVERWDVSYLVRKK